MGGEECGERLLLSDLFWRVLAPDGSKGQYPLPWDSPKSMSLVAQAETGTRGPPSCSQKLGWGLVMVSPLSLGAPLACASVPGQEGQVGSRDQQARRALQPLPASIPLLSLQQSGGRGCLGLAGGSAPSAAHIPSREAGSRPSASS